MLKRSVHRKDVQLCADSKDTSGKPYNKDKALNLNIIVFYNDLNILNNTTKRSKR